MGIELNPNAAATIINRASTYAKLNNPTAANADFEKGIELDPTSPFAYSERAIISIENNELDKAFIDLKKAEKIEAENTALQKAFGDYYYKIKNFKNALKAYSKAIKLKPRFAEAFEGRSKTYTELGENDKAKSDFEKFNELKNK